MKLRTRSEALFGGISNLKQIACPKQLRAALLMSALWFLVASSAMSQGIATGSISGTVSDPSGAVVPGARVTALNTATNQPFVAESNDVRFFAVRSLPPG